MSMQSGHNSARVAVRLGKTDLHDIAGILHEAPTRSALDAPTAPASVAVMGPLYTLLRTSMMTNLPNLSCRLSPISIVLSGIGLGKFTD
jgi:hypothetical protein